MTDIFAARTFRTCSNERELAAVGGELAAALRPGDVVAISGPLGSGKTSFVRAVVRALHGAGEATSPTFTFRHRYRGEPPVEHLDFYRIREERDVDELGLEEAFSGDAIVMVEWWENAAFLLPERRWHVRVDGSGTGTREVTITPP